MLHEDDFDSLHWDAPFTARIDSRAEVDGIWVYQIVEQDIDPFSGHNQDAQPARRGNARERMNTEVALGTLVSCQFRGIHDDEPLWEFSHCCSEDCCDEGCCEEVEGGDVGFPALPWIRLDAGLGDTVWDALDLTGATGVIQVVAGVLQVGTSIANMVTSASTLTDNAIVRGDGGSRGVQTSTATISDAGALSVALSGSGTTDQDEVLNLSRSSSGTVGDGFGLQVHHHLDTTTTADVIALRVATSWATAAHASRKSRTVFLPQAAAGGNEALRMEHSGTAAMISFLGANASAQLVSPDLGTLATTFGLASGTPTFNAANLTGSIATARLPTGDWITASQDDATLGAAFNITGSSGTYQDTGLSVSLPAAGKYLLLVQVRCTLTMATGTSAWITIKLHDSTNTADIADTETLTALVFATGVTDDRVSTIFALHTAAGAADIELHAARVNGTSYTTSQINTSMTKLGYIRLDE